MTLFLRGMPGSDLQVRCSRRPSDSKAGGMGGLGGEYLLVLSVKKHDGNPPLLKRMSKNRYTRYFFPVPILESRKRGALAASLSIVTISVHSLLILFNYLLTLDKLSSIVLRCNILQTFMISRTVSTWTRRSANSLQFRYQIRKRTVLTNRSDHHALHRRLWIHRKRIPVLAGLRNQCQIC